MRIVSAQIGLSDTGAGAGATAVQVNRNGVALVTTTALSVAQGAAAKAVKATVSGTPASYPGGQGVQPGDVITVDVLSVPAVTPPKVVTVVLSVTQTDV
jgi:ABC-type sulfate transport system permease component